MVDGEKVKQTLKEHGSALDHNFFDDVREYIEQLEERVAIATETKQGRWLDAKAEGYRCSVCQEALVNIADDWGDTYAYCPHCGALMEGVVSK